EQGFRLSLDAETSAVATFPVWAALATTLAIGLALAPGVVPRWGGGGAPASARSSVLLASAYAAAALVLPLVHAARHAGLGREAGGLPAIAAKLGDELGATLLILAAGLVLGAAAAGAYVAAAGAWPPSRSSPPSKDGGWGPRLRRGALWLALAVPFCAPGLWIGVV